jgi:UDP-N-acetylglucosamine 1-carboxyvinyltransferase
VTRQRPPRRNASRYLHIVGGESISGQIKVAGAKNAILPIMAASLLTDDSIVIKNIPHLDDVALMNQVLAGIGILPTINEFDMLELQGGVSSCVVPIDQTKQMRASILVLGPLLSRYGEATIPYPGGCMIGPRPVDLHLDGLRTLGAKIEEHENTIFASAPNGLIGAHIKFPYPTVGGTENLLMAATYAKGETVIENAATEPEVRDLTKCLIAMGAEIKGIGERKLIVRGGKKLKGCEHRIIPDRIEASTYLVAAASTRGKITLLDISPDIMSNILEPLKAIGAEINLSENSISLDMQGRRPKAIDIITGPYPQFPTDLQAQFTTLNAIAEGSSTVEDKVFNSRNSHLTEMHKMKADIKKKGTIVHIKGKERLQGAKVHARDLRASASLVIAGLVAEGETMVLDIEHIDRGYQWLEEQLQGLGANVTRKLYTA